MIYADYSSTSINKPKCVADAVSETILSNTGNPSRSTNACAMQSLRAVDKARQSVAKFFGLKEYWNVGFTLNSTHSLNLAIKGSLCSQDHVITSFWEHNSVLRPLYQVGAETSILHKDSMGNPDTRFLKSYIKPNTKAIIINIMSNVSGNIIDLEPIKLFAKENDLLLILDASQAAGQMDIKLDESFPRTLLAITGHKSLYGPMGVGALISYKVDKIKPLLSGGTGINSFSIVQPECFPDVCEAGTLNLPAIMGLKSAIDWNMEQDLAQRYKRLKAMRKRLIEELSEEKNITLYSNNLNGGSTIAINIGDNISQDISMKLENQYGILTRAGAHCAPLFHKEYGTETQGMVRFSLGITSSDEDIDACIYAIKKLASQSL